MKILGLIVAIFTHENYENKFNLPDGIIKTTVNTIQFISPTIFLICITLILFSFWKLIRAKTYEKNTWPTLLLVISITFFAFCLSISLNDLGFTIFKTIVPTVAGITAIALFLQNDQKNRMELNDRNKEYRKSLLIDRRNRYSEAVNLINSGREEGAIDGIRQLNSLLSDWSQDSSIDNSEINTEIDNITGKLSDTFRKHTKFKVKNPSQVEEDILSIISQLRGGYDPKGPRSSGRRTKMWAKIDERLYIKNLNITDMKKKEEKPTKWPMNRPYSIRSLSSSIDGKIYKFNLRNSKINHPINLPGFQELDFIGVNFYREFIIKPECIGKYDAYLIDTKFNDSTFHGPVEYKLTKFLFRSNESSFSGVTFMEPTSFESCIFLSAFFNPYAFEIEKSNFQAIHNSLNISDSIFYLPFGIKNSSVPDVIFSRNYITSSMHISKVQTNRIYFDECNLKSLRIDRIIRINENIPEVTIKDSTVQGETVIRDDYSGSTLDIKVEKSSFKKSSIFGDTGSYPANKVHISSSSFSELNISASLSATVEDISVNKLTISVGNESELDITIQNIRNKVSEIIIGSSYAQIRSLHLNNMHAKKIRFIEVNFSQIEEIELKSVKYKEMHFESCTFYDPDQEEEIKRLACTDDPGYKKTKPNTYRELIENYEYFSNLEDLGL